MVILIVPQAILYSTLTQTLDCFILNILFNLLLRLKIFIIPFSLTLNKLAPTSKIFHSGENCLLDLLWHLNRTQRASEHLLGCANGVIRSFSHINRLAQTSQGFRSGQNCFFDHPLHLDRPERTSQHPLGG